MVAGLVKFYGLSLAEVMDMTWGQVHTLNEQIPALERRFRCQL